MIDKWISVGLGSTMGGFQVVARGQSLIEKGLWCPGGVIGCTRGIRGE